VRRDHLARRRNFFSRNLVHRQQIRRMRPTHWMYELNRSLRQRQTRRKTGTQSHGPTSAPAETAAGPPKAPGRSESAALIRCGSGAFTCSARQAEGSHGRDRDQHRARTGNVACAPVVGLPGCSLQPRECALTNDCGRCHAAPTPDPDPRDTGPRSARRHRSGDSASFLHLGGCNPPLIRRHRVGPGPALPAFRSAPEPRTPGRPGDPLGPTRSKLPRFPTETRSLRLTTNDARVR
jgi:hypothetical protein